MICQAHIITFISFILLIDMKSKPIGMLDAQQQENSTTCGTSESSTCNSSLVGRLGCCSNAWATMTECYQENASNCTADDKTCMKTLNGRFEFECRHQQTKYHGVKINDSSTRISLLPRYNKTCNPVLYNQRMRPIWERFLLCPFDHEFYDKDLEELIDDWHYHDNIMDDVCFSFLIEECNPITKRCECFKKAFVGSDNLTVVLNFTQNLEGVDHCGQLAGQACTHNVKAIKENKVKLKDKHGTQCKVTPKGGMLVPATFQCELDAGCDSLLEKGEFCPMDKTCNCVCAAGYSCIGSSAQSMIMMITSWTKLSFLTMMAVSFLIS